MWVIKWESWNDNKEEKDFGGGGGVETFDICYSLELSWYGKQNYCDYKAKYTHTHTHIHIYINR